MIEMAILCDTYFATVKKRKEAISFSRRALRRSQSSGAVGEAALTLLNLSRKARARP